MLYDPKWDAVIHTAPSLEGLIAWLETKPAKGRYPFNDCSGECLLGQYMEFLGIPWGSTPSRPHLVSWDGTNYMKVGRAIFGKREFNELAMKPWTYGAALARCRAALPSQELQK